MEGRIERHKILGGVINEYRRPAWLDRRNPRSHRTHEFSTPYRYVTPDGAYVLVHATR
jgi:hypothetical protein